MSVRNLMKRSEEYFHCNKKVLLEECIPSLRNNIWSYRTSRVFSISCVHVMVNGLWFILGLIEVYLQIWYRYLTTKYLTPSTGRDGNKLEENDPRDINTIKNGVTQAIYTNIVHYDSAI
jgi:hypothetical protein